jgi:glycogenin glucosyltransferase
MTSPFAFVTLVSSDSYLPGALAQVAALRDIHPTPPTPPEVDFTTVCIVTPESLDIATIKRLRKEYDLVVGVEILEQENQKGLDLLGQSSPTCIYARHLPFFSTGRPDLTTVLTKLHIFRLTQFQKIIFLDADVLPIRPLSHLFNVPHEFSAAPDVGWPDIFNSGVLVVSPGNDKFNELYELIKTKPSWDGGDQGLLNEWRGENWNRLSFTYNTTPTAAYTYVSDFFFSLSLRHISNPQ